MSRTLDASLDDPQPAEAEARRLLARSEEREMGQYLRRMGEGMIAAGQTNIDRADLLDPRPVPFSRIRVGDQVWLEDQLYRVLQKRTVNDVDGTTTDLCVAEPDRHSGYWVRIEPGQLLTRSAF